MQHKTLTEKGICELSRVNKLSRCRKKGRNFGFVAYVLDSLCEKRQSTAVRLKGEAAFVFGREFTRHTERHSETKYGA
jgi:hypothetical protein